MRKGQVTQAAIQGASLPSRILRGQAAIEYLTTYGWAILALVIVFAALISSGALTPNYLVSEECSFGTNFQCHDAVFNDASKSSMNIQLFNGFPYKIKVVSFNISMQDGTRSVDWGSATQTALTNGFEIESGSNKTLSGIVSGAKFPAGSIKKFFGNITYVSCAPELGGCTDSAHVISGRITAKVQ
jgi:hypothetical protein